MVLKQQVTLLVFNKIMSKPRSSQVRSGDEVKGVNNVCIF